MKNNLAILLLFLTGFITHLCAQVNPSPNAMGYLNSGVEEDLYRGYVTETIPLCAAEGLTGYQVPVALSYQTKGIRVSEIASSVGLGWNLVAGGAITRVMRDEPDDQSTFDQDLTKADAEFKEVTKTKGKDLEKDIFHLVFPGGGAKFVSGSNSLSANTTHTSFYGLPHHDYSISFIKTSDTVSHWEVIDLQGVTYIFGKNDEAREVSSISSYKDGSTPKANDEWEYISTWHLEYIVLPNIPTSLDKSHQDYGNVIVFTYEKDELATQEISYSYSKTFELDEKNKLWGLELINSSGNIFFIKGYVPRDWEEQSQYPMPIKQSVMTGDGLFSDDILSIPYGGDIIWSTVQLSNKHVNEVGYWLEWNELQGNIFSTDMDEYSGEDEYRYPMAEFKYFQNWLFHSYYGWQEFLVQFYRLKDGDGNPQEHTRRVFENNVTMSKLTSISSNKAFVEFVYGSRYDAQTERLDNIRVYEQENGNLVHQVGLTYDYFDAGCSDPLLCKRLKLESVSKNDLLIAKFDYVNDALPSRASFSTDRLGYYKDIEDLESSVYHSEKFNTCKYFDKLPSYPSNDTYECYLSIGGVNKNPGMAAQANSLWKINYSTQAYKEFSYDDNENGGVKIKSIKVVNADTSVVEHVSYQYGNAINKSAATQSPMSSDLEITIFSTSPYLTQDHISLSGYKSVTILNKLTNMSTEYEFMSGNINDSGEKTLRDSDWDEVESDLPSSFLPILPPSFTPFYGLPEKITSKDSVGGIISKQTFSYDYDADNEFSFIEHALIRAENGDYFVTEQTHNVRPFYVEAQTTTSYEGDEVITSTTTFDDYHDTYKTLLKEMTVVKSSGHKTKSFTYYPSDYSEVSAFYTGTQADLSYMVNDHMIGVPIASQAQVVHPHYTSTEGFRTSAASFTVFDQVSNLSQPIETHQLFITEPDEGTTWTSAFEKTLTRSYNSDGLLISQVGQDGVTVTYGYDAAGYLTSESTELGMTTSYTYEPLVGLKTVTDPSGRKVSYEYDNHKRLHLIRDNDNNIVKRYRYNLLEDAGLGANIQVSGETKENVSLTFSAVNITGYGGAEMVTYLWDLPDESQGEESSIITSFSSAGEKTVKLTLVSPEYEEPVQISKTIYVYEPTSFALSGANEGCLFSDGDPSGEVYYDFYLTNSGYPCTASVVWSYQAPGSTGWNTFDTGVSSSESISLSNRYLSEGSYTIRAVTTGCHSQTVTKSFEIVDCSGGGGGGGEDPPVCENPVSVTPSNWVFESAELGNFQQFTISESGLTITDDQPWIATSLSGTTLTVTCDPHYSGPARYGTVTIGTGACAALLSITEYSIPQSCSENCEWDPIDGRCEQIGSGAGCVN